MHGSSPTTGAPARILVLYSDIGEGHAATARAIGAELAQESPDAEVVLENGLAHMGRFLQYLQRDLYHAQLLRGPWLYGVWYAIFATSRILRALGALALCLLASRPLFRLVSAQKPDLIVSTDPRVSVVLGHLRMRGKLTMPLCATLTDLGGLKFWVHPGVDVHLTTHPRLVPAVERLAGKGSARLVCPPVHPAFYASLGKAEAREALTLPAGRTLVLVSGGGWGTGDLEGALLAALSVPDALVLCLCGRNEGLRARLEQVTAARPEDACRVRLVGFTERMPEWLAAVDVLVHSTGGVTCLEASVRRCPVVIYGAPAGHPRRIARVMEGLKEASFARSREELSALLVAAAGEGAAPGRDPRFDQRAGAAIVAAQARPHSWWSVVPWLTLSDKAARESGRRPWQRRLMPRQRRRIPRQQVAPVPEEA